MQESFANIVLLNKGKNKTILSFPFIWLYFNRRIYEYGSKVKAFSTLNAIYKVYHNSRKCQFYHFFELYHQ